MTLFQKSGNAPWKSLLVMSTAPLGYSTLAIFGKVFFAYGIPASLILLWRFGGAALILCLFQMARRRWRLPLKQALACIGLGIVGQAIQTKLFFASLSINSASMAAMLLYTYPAFVAILMWCIEGEKLGSKGIVALALAILGCGLTLDFAHVETNLWGLGLGLASGIWYALYLTITSQIIRRTDPVTTASYLMLGAACTFSALVFWDGIWQAPFALNPKITWAVCGIILLSTVLPIVTLFHGVKRMGASRAAIICTLEPLATVALGVMFLGESLGIYQVLGGLCIVASVLMLRMDKPRHSERSKE